MDFTIAKIASFIGILASVVDEFLAIMCLTGALFSMVDSVQDTNARKLLFLIISIIPSYLAAPLVANYLNVPELYSVVGFGIALTIRALSGKLLSLIGNWKFGDRI